MIKGKWIPVIIDFENAVINHVWFRTWLKHTWPIERVLAVSKDGIMKLA
jgi:hypothetical protein